MKLKGVESI